MPPARAPARMHGLIADLRRTKDEIDGAFVSVGARLSECASILAELTATFEGLPRDLQSTDLATATERIALIGQRAEEIAAALAGEQRDLTELVGAVEGAGRPIAELVRSVKMMGIVSVNARVVAAGVADGTHDFDVFTTDIAQLSDSAATAIAEFSSVYERLRRVVGEAAAAHARFEETRREPLADLGRRLAASLEAITEYRHTASQSVATTSTLSAQIGARVASTVMALQIGDATRQRLEHAEDALAQLDAAAVAGIAVPEEEREALAAALAELQRRQLAAATRDFDSEVADGRAALDDLARDARAILTHTQEVHGDGEANGGSALATLQADMRRATEMLRDCERERQTLGKVAATVAETVETLFGHVTAVQEIEAAMRLVSLNAAVRCAQLGPKGKSLEVIALQLRSLTNETVVSATTAIERLNEAAGLAQRVSSSAGAAAGELTGLEREATASLDLLAEVAARVADALQGLKRSGPVVVRRLEEAAADLSGHTAIAESLRDIEHSLAALLADKPTPQAPPTEAATEVLRALRRRYTMDAERRVHDDYLGIAPEPPSAAEPERPDAIDDLLF